MANRVKMAVSNAVIVLWRRGYSFRKIARELGIHRETVSRHVRIEQAGSKPAEVIAGNSVVRSACEPFRQLVLSKLDMGLSA